jgi:ABC-type amino acid transport substrate-binding protein
LDIDLAKAVLEQAGLKYELINVGTNLNTLLETCQISLGIAAIPMADNLRTQMLLSDPYYATGHSVVTKKGNLLINGRDQLAGAVVGAQTTSVSELEIATIQGAKAKPYATYSAAFLDLANGYIDAVIVDTPRAQNFAAIKRYDLKIAGPAFGSVQYAMGVCKKDQDLLKQVNESLSKLKKDGGLEKIISRWISK